MNIFRKYTLKSLWQNKTRTLVTIVGIILSVAMITAVATTVSSLQNYMLEVVIQNSGSWYCSVLRLDHDRAQEILSREEVDKKAVLADVEFARLERVKKESTPYLYIAGFSGDFADLLTVRMKEGRLPENSSELMVPSDLSDRAGLDYKVGDSVRLEAGIRKEKETSVTMWQDWSYEPDEEEFISSGEKTYHIVGIYDSAQFGYWGYWGNYSYVPGYPVLTRLDDKIQAAKEMIYMTLDDAGELDSFEKQLEEEVDWDGDVCGFNRNGEYLKFSGKSMSGGLAAMLSGLIAVLIGIIMFGSIALICNSFAISVNERKKQYGLLSSIGATRRQLRRSVLFEAVLVSLAGVPLGILAGIGGMGVTFYLLRDTFATFLASGSGIEIHVSTAVWAVVLSAAVGFITVLISAWLPARKALKINVIDAIRQTTDIAVKPRKLKTSRLTRKLFGLEGILASKNYKRNKRKYRATVFSLFISVVLFVSASSFSSYLSTGLNDMLRSYDCDLRYSDMELNDGDRGAKLYQELSQAGGVTEHNYHNTCWEAHVNVSAGCLSESIRKVLGESADPADEEKIIDVNGTIVLVFIPDEEYEDYLRKNKLDVSRYMDAENPAALLFDYKGPIYSNTEQRYVYSNIYTSKPDSVELSYEVYPEEPEEIELEEDSTWENEPMIVGKKKITVGELRAEKLAGFEQEQDRLAMLTFPESALRAIVPDEVAVEYIMNFKSDNPDRTEELMQEILDEHGGGYLFNVNKEIKVSRALMTILNIFSFGFIVLISLIAVANVFNTISTNVFLRKREFAMLRSVGMTKKSFNKMMNFECLLYGVKGLMYGLPVAIGITALIWYSVGQEIAIGFYIPWYSIVIAVSSVFLVVFATMLYAMGKIRKDNVVETLKEENY